ncbi:hypothetical protein MASR2M74_15600 [Paracoccaceae bacterium]
MSALAEALRCAGFPGVEVEGGRVFARLVSADVEFSGVECPEGWALSIRRAVRANPAQLADWAARHPGVALDIHQGETRLRGLVAPGDREGLLHWAALAEEMVVACLHWRRAQRARGEGM